MNSSIGIGIIGTGSIALTYIKCINEIDDAQLHGLFTSTFDRKSVLEKELSVPVFSNLDEFLQHPNIDLIIVCNQSGLHGKAVISAANAGKHILCEKPLEVTPQKIDIIIDACKTNNVKLGCVLQNRCTEDYKIVEKTVKEGLLGKLLMGNAQINWYRNPDYYSQKPWRGTKALDGGAALMNQGIHTIDLLLNLMGDVATVFGNVTTLVHPIEGEDVATALLNYKNGAIGTISGGTALFPGYPERIEVYGENGSVLMESGKIIQWNVKGVAKPIIKSATKATGASDPNSIGHENHKIVLTDMINAINTNCTPMVSGIEARKAVAFICALYKSSETQQLQKVN